MNEVPPLLPRQLLTELDRTTAPTSSQPRACFTSQ
jgi:hypothetical protein